MVEGEEGKCGAGIARVEGRGVVIGGVEVRVKVGRFVATVAALVGGGGEGGLITAGAGDIDAGEGGGHDALWKGGGRAGGREPGGGNSCSGSPRAQLWRKWASGGGVLGLL